MGKPGKKAGAGRLPPTNPNRGTDKQKTHLRDQRTIKRLKMYSSKIVRDAEGTIVKGSVLSASDRITQSMARIAPDRRWFGNTRVIGQQALQKFRTEMGAKYRDPYSVVIKQSKLPLSLLEEPDAQAAAAAPQQQMQFAQTFGERSTRKRVQLSTASLEALAARAQSSKTTFNEKTFRGRKQAEDAATAGAIAAAISGAPSAGPTPVPPSVSTDEMTHDRSTHRSLFKKGQSNRIWNELYKIIDSADVLCYVVDARDPIGTRSPFLEDYMRREKKYKHFVLVLNKCDLIPLWATARWLQILSKDFPTVAFHASVNHPFGKGNLISLIRQFSRLHNVAHRGSSTSGGRSSKTPISIGIVGYPNVGKSSVINTLRRKSVCRSAPIPGETKVWQYVALTRSIFLIDSPGIVYDREGNDDVQAVLKGVVRVERLGALDKSDVVQAVLGMVREKDLVATYGITGWTDANSFCEMLARARGKLLPGNMPHTDAAARSVLYDWQRGRIPWFIPPPFDTEKQREAARAESDVAHLRAVERMNTFRVVDDRIEMGAEGAAAAVGEEEPTSFSDESDEEEIEADGVAAPAAAAAKPAARGGAKVEEPRAGTRRTRAAADGKKEDDDEGPFATVASVAAAETERLQREKRLKERAARRAANTTAVTAGKSEGSGDADAWAAFVSA